jgi:hypothetical protein
MIEHINEYTNIKKNSWDNENRQTDRKTERQTEKQLKIERDLDFVQYWQTRARADLNELYNFYVVVFSIILVKISFLKSMFLFGM